MPIFSHHTLLCNAHKIIRQHVLHDQGIPIAMRIILGVLLCSLVCQGIGLETARAEEAKPRFYRKLFNGKDLTGWKTLPGGSWQVEQQAIIGRSKKSESRHGMLITEEQFGDFELRLRFQVLEGNSGVYFRCEPVEEAVGVHGLQAEVENSALVGGLYETGGRGWVVKPNTRLTNHIYKAAEWNDLHIRASGREITVTLNGHQTAHLKDDPGRLKGHIALQLHGGQEMWVLFKNLEIKSLED